jgi:Protein of unknown function (DUF3501)
VKRLEAKELWSNAVYQVARDEFRQKIIALKQPRRIALGGNVTVLFENHDTLRFQVQEMLRAEGLTDPAAIQAEVDVYNALMPGADELSATLMIEVVEESKIREVLDSLLGMEESLYLTFGTHEIRAKFEEGRSDGARISAVQYIRFPFTSVERDAFVATKSARLELRHPTYQATTDLAPATLTSLRADLLPD